MSSLVFRKTESGKAEIAQRQAGLVPAARQLLILVNGVDSVQALLAKGLGDVRGHLDTLLSLRLIERAPAPLVLHGMGKDAKAIKFMVNVNRDMSALFTQTAAELGTINGPAWVVMDRKDYQRLQGTVLGNTAPVLSARFDKNDYVLLKKP